LRENAKPKKDGLHFENLKESIDSFASTMSLLLEGIDRLCAEENLSSLH
jgi:hypothetical protein